MDAFLIRDIWLERRSRSSSDRVRYLIIIATLLVSDR
jgi:hypothetical protein